jgi:outer membrane receptor for ferric coprogen and ferric-rhodotorulic acid
MVCHRHKHSPDESGWYATGINIAQMSLDESGWYATGINIAQMSLDGMPQV